MLVFWIKNIAKINEENNAEGRNYESYNAVFFYQEGIIFVNETRKCHNVIRCDNFCHLNSLSVISNRFLRLRQNSGRFYETAPSDLPPIIVTVAVLEFVHNFVVV